MLQKDTPTINDEILLLLLDDGKRWDETLLDQDVLRAATKGFLAGMLGPKRYRPNDWKTLDPKRMVWQRSGSLIGHLADVLLGKPDPDTGMEDNHIFLLTNTIMITYFIMKLKKDNPCLRNFYSGGASRKTRLPLRKRIGRYLLLSFMKRLGSLMKKL